MKDIVGIADEFGVALDKVEEDSDD